MLGILLCLVAFNVAAQGLLQVRFSDLPNDSNSEIDLTSLTLTFDPATGEYQLLFEADPSHPFQGSFFVEANIFNGGLGTRNPNPTFFTGRTEIVSQACASVIVEIRDFSQTLQQWSEGDRVAPTGPVPLGIPTFFPDPISAFSSGVAFPFRVRVPDDAVGVGEFDTLRRVDFFLPVSHPPSVNDDQFSILEDSGLTEFDVLANDCVFNPQAEPLAITTLLPISLQGEATINANRDRILYTPPDNFFGLETLEYIAIDANGLTGRATVSITVEPVNDLPVARDDFVQIDEDAPFVSIDPLINDSFEPDVGETLSIVAVDQLVPGITLVGNRVEYRPPANFFGQENVSYTVSDGNGAIAMATISIDVVSVNDPPQARNDRFEINGRGGQVTLDVLMNDSVEPDRDEALTIVAFDAPADLGALVLENGFLLLSPTGNFEGELGIQYTISDGKGGTANAVATVDVILPNRDPIARDDLEVGFEDSKLLIDVLGNDTSEPDEGEVLRLIGVGDGQVGASIVIEGNQVSYLAPQDFFGEDQFTYTIDDSHGGVATGTVRVTIENINDPPTANPDEYTILEDSGPSRLDPLVNDSAAPDIGETLRIESVSLQSGQGELNLDGNMIVVEPPANYHGLIEFTYLLQDSSGGESIGEVVVVVESVNDLPVAQLDLVTVSSAVKTVEIDVLANDSTEPDVGEILEIKTVFAGHVEGGVVTHDGQLVTVELDDGFTGSESFRYIVQDGNGGEASALVLLNVVPDLILPEAVDDLAETDEEVSVQIDVLANDQIDPNERQGLVLEVVSDSEHAQLSVGENNRIVYEPSKDFYGLDQFEYRISYRSGESSVGVVQVSVKNVNDPPVAVDDSIVLSEDSPFTILDVLANDSSAPDPDEDLSVIAVVPTIGGGEVVLEDGVVRYRPRPNEFGSDAITYVLSDPGGELTRGRVMITVEPVNDPPRLLDDTIEISAGTTEITIDVLANDSTEPEPNETLSLLATTSAPSGANVSIVEDRLVYQLVSGFVGRDEFIYSASDGNGGVSTASVTVTVIPGDETPVAVADNFDIPEDAPLVVLAVLANDLSGAVGGNKLELVAVTSPSAGGVVRIVGDVLHYTSSRDYFGVETFSYEIQEGAFTGIVAEVRIEVLPENDPPIALPDSFQLVNRLEPFVLDVLKNDSITPDLDETLVITEIQTPSESQNRFAIVEGGIQYQPLLNFSGEEQFQYTVSDGNGGVAVGDVVVVVGSGDQAPVAIDDVFEIDEDAEAVKLSVLANDRSGALAGQALRIESFVVGSLAGELILDEGIFVYTPAPDFFGQERFTYQVAENDLAGNSAEVIVRVKAVNDPPSAVDDHFVFENPAANVLLNVLANDSFAPDTNEQLEIESVESSKEGGSPEVVGDQIRFPVPAGFEGVDEFDYILGDGNGGQSRGTVTLQITRVDNIPPIARCQDVEVLLDENGLGSISSAQVDAGSADNSGSVRLSLDRTEFGVSDLGENQVTLTVTDDAGNQSTCTASVNVVQLSEAIVSIVSPRPFTAVGAEEVYFFAAADVPVVLTANGEFERIQLFGDGQMLTEFNAPPSNQNLEWLWEEVPIGDHRLQVIGLTRDGLEVQSVPVVFSVSELAARVILVRSDGLNEGSLQHARELLFEMGVDVHVLAEADLTTVNGTEFDLLIWEHLDPETTLTGSVDELTRLGDAGLAMYLLGPDLLSFGSVLDEGARRQWLELSLLDPVNDSSTIQGEVVFGDDDGNGLLAGRFGRVNPFELSLTSSAFAAGGNVEPVLSLDGFDVAVRSQVLEGGERRRFSQLFALQEGESAGVPEDRRVLFQNAVCWLLEQCQDCRNARILSGARDEISSINAGDVLRVRYSVENNGACEVTGARLRLSGDGVFVESLVADGRQLPLVRNETLNQWTGVLGRLGRGGVAAQEIEWRVRGLVPGKRELRIETFSNNTEPSKFSVPVEILGVSYQMIAFDETSLTLRIEGGDGAAYALQETQDLAEPVKWLPLNNGSGIIAGGTVDVVVPIEGDVLHRFIRVIVP